MDEGSGVVSDVAWVPSSAQELPHAAGMPPSPKKPFNGRNYNSE